MSRAVKKPFTLLTCCFFRCCKNAKAQIMCRKKNIFMLPLCNVSIMFPPFRHKRNLLSFIIKAPGLVLVASHNGAMWLQRSPGDSSCPLCWRAGSCYINLHLESIFRCSHCQSVLQIEAEHYSLFDLLYDATMSVNFCRRPNSWTLSFNNGVRFDFSTPWMKKPHR